MDVTGHTAIDCTPLPGFAAVAAWEAWRTRGDADVALVLGPTTIFKGFLDGQYDQDDDSDGMLDITELWINMINGIMEGFSAYDLIYVDDTGRAKLCINSQTGDYSYKVLQGHRDRRVHRPGVPFHAQRDALHQQHHPEPPAQFYDNQRFHKRTDRSPRNASLLPGRQEYRSTTRPPATEACFTPGAGGCYRLPVVNFSNWTPAFNRLSPISLFWKIVLAPCLLKS